MIETLQDDLCISHLSLPSFGLGFHRCANFWNLDKNESILSNIVPFIQAPQLSIITEMICRPIHVKNHYLYLFVHFQLFNFKINMTDVAVQKLCSDVCFYVIFFFRAGIPYTCMHRHDGIPLVRNVVCSLVQGIRLARRHAW